MPASVKESPAQFSWKARTNPENAGHRDIGADLLLGCVFLE